MPIGNLAERPAYSSCYRSMASSVRARAKMANGLHLTGIIVSHQIVAEMQQLRANASSSEIVDNDVKDDGIMKRGIDASAPLQVAAPLLTTNIVQPCSEHYRFCYKYVCVYLSHTIAQPNHSLVCWLPNMAAMQPSSSFRLLSRQLRPRLMQSRRCLSKASTRFEQKSDQTRLNNAPKTVDFGFETVAESLKASRG